MEHIRFLFSNFKNRNDHPEVESLIIKFQHRDQFTFILNNRNILKILSMVLSYLVVTEQLKDFTNEQQ